MIKTKAGEKLIVALDTSSIEEAETLITELKDLVGMFKIGLELYSKYGVEVYKLIEKHNIKVFFDCKYMDIPNTVAMASRNLVNRGVSMFNLHATGGLEMMKAAKAAITEEAKKNNVDKPLLIAVTILTSMSEKELQEEQSVKVPIREQVTNLARLAQKAGLDGVVASAQEARLIREATDEKFLIVTPGIRPSWAQANDQTRIVTPSKALSDGASFLVVGRPITRAENRMEATMKIIEEMDSAIKH